MEVVHPSPKGVEEGCALASDCLAKPLDDLQPPECWAGPVSNRYVQLGVPLAPRGARVGENRGRGRVGGTGEVCHYVNELLPTVWRGNFSPRGRGRRGLGGRSCGEQKDADLDCWAVVVAEAVSQVLPPELQLSGLCRHRVAWPCVLVAMMPLRSLSSLKALVPKHQGDLRATSSNG